jgi:hypothetical protein
MQRMIRVGIPRSMVHGLWSLLLLSCVLCPLSSEAQGPLAPTNAPAPSMKTLQEIWDLLTAQQGEIQTLQQQNMVLANALGANLPWQITRVYTNGFTGTGPSIAYGPGGKPGVAFGEGYIGVTSRLHYAAMVGNSWTTTVADSTDDSGWSASLAFSPSGRPYVSHVLYAAQILRVSWFNGSVWTHTNVATGADFAQTSLAFGPDGQPAIAYGDDTAGSLKYARFNGVGLVQRGGGERALGAGGVTQIRSRWAAGHQLLRLRCDHAHAGDQQRYGLGQPAGGRTIGGVRQRPRLFPEGRPLISYWDEAANQINLAKYDGFSFASDIVDTGVGGINGSITSMGLNMAGRPVIAYWDSVLNDLKFAEYDGAAWSVSTLDAINAVGFVLSMAVSPAGEISIAYTDSTTQDLKVARRGLPVLMP